MATGLATGKRTMEEKKLMTAPDRADLGMVAESVRQPDAPDLDRLLYATFPPGLKAALRTAAARHGWDRATWRSQTQLIHDALRSGRQTAEALATAYHLPPETAP